MKALVIDGKKSSRIISVEPTPVGPGQVRLRVRHVGLCGSDLNTFRGLNPLVELPRIPGHEIGGVVLEVGPGAENLVKVGAGAIVIPYTNCGTCPACRKGRLNACRFNKTLGVQQNGGLAEEIVISAAKLITSDTLAPDRLPLVEPLSVGFHAVARGRVSAGDRVVVIGCGMIGMGAIIAAAAQGAEVLAVEISRVKRQVALQFGAVKAVDPLNEDVGLIVEAWTSGDMADVVFEAVGLPQTFTQAVDLACFAGRVVYIGYSKAPVTYESKWFNLKELDIHGSRNATLEDFVAVANYLEKSRTNIDSLISKTFTLAEADRALPYWDDNPDVLKILVEV